MIKLDKKITSHYFFGHTWWRINALLPYQNMPLLCFHQTWFYLDSTQNCITTPRLFSSLLAQHYSKPANVALYTYLLSWIGGWNHPEILNITYFLPVLKLTRQGKLPWTPEVQWVPWNVLDIYGKMWPFQVMWRS